MKITVLHNVSRDASFGLNTVFGPVGKTYQAGSHPLVKVFEFDADSMTPDEVFHAFNVGDDPAHAVSAAEQELAGAYRARRLRALSVGDVLACEAAPGDPGADPGYLACASDGWTVVPAGDLAILGPGEAEAVIRERYDIGPDEELTVTVPLLASPGTGPAQSAATENEEE